MASENLELVILCMLVEDVPLEDRPEGSIEDPCSGCGAAIVLAPSSQQQLARGGSAAFCDRCAMARFEQPLEMRLLPGQREEIRKHFGLETPDVAGGSSPASIGFLGDGEPKR